MLNGSPHASGVNDLALREMEAVFKENQDVSTIKMPIWIMIIKKEKEALPFIQKKLTFIGKIVKSI